MLINRSEPLGNSKFIRIPLYCSLSSLSYGDTDCSGDLQHMQIPTMDIVMLSDSPDHLGFDFRFSVRVI